MRLDKYLVDKHLSNTRSKAQDLIKSGYVKVNEKIITKCSYLVLEKDNIELEDLKLQFVSRAGFKLYYAIKHFQIDLQNRVVIDVGASTGGFSDVCLKQGSKFIYAVDVGHDQLHPSLQNHHRLMNLENTNCRYLRKDMFQLPIDFACIDVSFISITKILPSVFSIMEQVEVIALIKPQFEVGKQYLNKHGIVKDKHRIIDVLSSMIEFVLNHGYYVHHIEKSSIKGRDGNQEFIFHIKSDPTNRMFQLKEIVNNTCEEVI